MKRVIGDRCAVIGGEEVPLLMAPKGALERRCAKVARERAEALMALSFADRETLRRYARAVRRDDALWDALHPRMRMARIGAGVIALGCVVMEVGEAA